MVYVDREPGNRLPPERITRIDTDEHGLAKTLHLTRLDDGLSASADVTGHESQTLIPAKPVIIDLVVEESPVGTSEPVDTQALGGASLHDGNS